MNQHMTMMDYILLQPETMQEIFDNRQESLKDFLAFYQQVQPDHVYIIASGSSYNASCAARRVHEPRYGRGRHRALPFPGACYPRCTADDHGRVPREANPPIPLPPSTR